MGKEARKRYKQRKREIVLLIPVLTTEQKGHLKNTILPCFFYIFQESLIYGFYHCCVFIVSFKCLVLNTLLDFPQNDFFCKIVTFLTLLSSGGFYWIFINSSAWVKWFYSFPFLLLNWLCSRNFACQLIKWNVRDGMRDFERNFKS